MGMSLDLNLMNHTIQRIRTQDAENDLRTVPLVPGPLDIRMKLRKDPCIETPWFSSFLSVAPSWIIALAVSAELATKSVRLSKALQSKQIQKFPCSELG